MTVLMSPDMANFSGNVHGGAMLRLLDQVAYACASRYSGTYVVTLSVDQVFFLKPVHVGELVTFLASINYTGRTSMEVGMRVMAENIRERTERHVMTCYFTMIAVDAQGNPTTVPPVQTNDATEQRRFREAQLRRQLRREIEQRTQEIKAQGQRSVEPHINDTP
ncbi:MAG: acyl-CoA thioesterase [Chloroflexaceae bacterium]|nr:acyl-CoA thioesterase [Chloroflexaceae bacterium]NJO06252.1 acyl-CoA thioesterase [Chloroflexaceae bacterium]